MSSKKNSCYDIPTVAHPRLAAEKSLRKATIAWQALARPEKKMQSRFLGELRVVCSTLGKSKIRDRNETKTFRHRLHIRFQSLDKSSAIRATL